MSRAKQEEQTTMATRNIGEIEDVFRNLKLSNLSNDEIYSTIHNLVEEAITSLEDLPDNKSEHIKYIIIMLGCALGNKPFSQNSIPSIRNRYKITQYLATIEQKHDISYTQNDLSESISNHFAMINSSKTMLDVEGRIVRNLNISDFYFYTNQVRTAERTLDLFNAATKRRSQEPESCKEMQEPKNLSQEYNANCNPITDLNIAAETLIKIGQNKTLETFQKLKSDEDKELLRRSIINKLKEISSNINEKEELRLKEEKQDNNSSEVSMGKDFIYQYLKLNPKLAIILSPMTKIIGQNTNLPNELAKIVISYQTTNQLIETIFSDDIPGNNPTNIAAQEVEKRQKP